MKKPSYSTITIRRTWGDMNPSSKPFKSKKDYNRKDKSWKRMED